MTSSSYAQSIRFFEFGSEHLSELTHTLAPVWSRKPDALRQLKYIEAYLRRIGCRGVAVEMNYIDRDHMEDHSIFYSRSLFPYSNRCKRLHFFNIPDDQVRSNIRNILLVAKRGDSSEYVAECSEFSRRHYLGFVVIKPLPGSPIGRTVLRCYESDPNVLRSFNCVRDYRLHFNGLELTVRGLAFQQQDVGVSACATTALWSALNKVSDLEHIAAATPAQITSLASRHSLPFGRAMPSEGLSLDQMCQAVHALGVAPYLLRVAEGPVKRRRTATRKPSELAKAARAYLHSATLSGMPSILVLDSPTGRHAVTVVGMRLNPTVLARDRTGLVDQSEELQSLYVHDDRVGPYVRADLDLEGGSVVASLRTKTNPDRFERWRLSHILIPLHPKIRFSFAGLRDLALETSGTTQAICEATSSSAGERHFVRFSTRIALASQYAESILLDPDISSDAAMKLITRFVLPRYVGIVRLSSPSFDAIDLVVDTTSTHRNAHVICVLAHHQRVRLTSVITGYLDDLLGVNRAH